MSRSIRPAFDTLRHGMREHLAVLYLVPEYQLQISVIIPLLQG
jgi:hypothetical protein